MLTKTPARVHDPSSAMRVSPAVLGVTEARSALLVPLVYRDEALGMMAALDRDAELPEFDESDEKVLLAFAANAATAVGQHRRAEQT
jgi:GAF domain-containing protein